MTICVVKFRLFEKHKNLKKNPLGFDKSTDLHSKRQNLEDFFKLCAILKKSELYKFDPGELRESLGLINNQFGTIQVLRRSSIPQTSNWSGTFLLFPTSNRLQYLACAQKFDKNLFTMP